MTADALGCVAVEAVSGFVFVAAEYDRDEAMAGARLEATPGIRGGRDLAYGAITHAKGIAYERAIAPATAPAESPSRARRSGPGPRCRGAARSAPCAAVAVGFSIE